MFICFFAFVVLNTEQVNCRKPPPHYKHKQQIVCDDIILLEKKEKDSVTQHTHFLSPFITAMATERMQ
jgi:hypothetical protein